MMKVWVSDESAAESASGKCKRLMKVQGSLMKVQLIIDDDYRISRRIAHLRLMR